MVRAKTHKIKAITIYEDYIGMCGKPIPKNKTTHDTTKVTCLKCLKVMNNG